MSLTEKSEHAWTRDDLDFLSQGTRCAGWLYRPTGDAKPPLVVMAHGFAAERTFGLPAFAERFASRGLAVFAFDYRNFGASDGMPRNLVNPFRHLQDWEAAVSFVRTLPRVASDRIALWGSSFSGGHVIVTAARNPRIAAIVAQVPFVDGVATLRTLGLGYFFRALAAGTRDLARMVTLRDPYCIPVVSSPDRFAAMNKPDALEGYKALVPPESAWKNECPARILLAAPLYRPISYAAQVRCPALLVAAEKDSLIPVEAVARTAARMPAATLEKVPAGHFDVYVGEWFERVVKIESDFLATHLLGAS